MRLPTLLVLGDQLNRHHGPLADHGPGNLRVLMIESRDLLTGLPHHAQKLILVLSAMRHFAADLEADGYDVDYVRHDDPTVHDFASGVRDHCRRLAPTSLLLQQPNDHGVAEAVDAACRAEGVHLEIAANPLWIVPDATYDAWAEGRATLRLEHFYRMARRETGILLEPDGEPRGGQWNYDAENRKPPDPKLRPPQPARFLPDAMTREVQKEVGAALGHAWGAAEPFAWPVTRDDASATLEAFLRDRLARFGDYQDAMVEGEPILWHSTLSVPLNLGLLHPKEVLDAALAHADAHPTIQLNALEGFVRQILGWREFLHHVYRTRGHELRAANALDATRPLPPAYWGAPTELRCLGATIEQLHATGYTHHIQRLMVLGNLAQLVGVEPSVLVDWFTATHVDALDWVMVPNVMAMSQYADGGTITSKPYAAGANYLNRMSNHCGACRFDPKARRGPDACPVTAWYWAFLEQHQERLQGNPRMRMILASWRKRAPEERDDLLQRAQRTRTAFLEGRL